jgi:general secretion pathway protein N
MPIRRRPGDKADMVRWFNILGFVLLAGTLTVGRAPEGVAATSATLDILPGEGAGEAAGTVDLGSLKPISGLGPQASKPLPSGNPLWAVPLSAMTATQERPIFSASRRTPPRAVAPPVNVVSAPVPPRPAEPEHPPLALIGAVVGDGEAIAVFLDRTNQKVVRLRQGDSHAGWVLNSVLPREVTLQKADQTEVLALKRQDGPVGVPAFPANVAGPAVPVATGVGNSYAPFVPRSTPKNGESDGL